MLLQSEDFRPSRFLEDRPMIDVPLPRAIVGTLGLLPLGLVTLLAQGPASGPAQLARDVYREIVNINTVTATGDTAKAAEAMAARLRRGGYANADVQVF